MSKKLTDKYSILLNNNESIKETGEFVLRMPPHPQLAHIFHSQLYHEFCPEHINKNLHALNHVKTRNLSCSNYFGYYFI